MEKTTLAPIEIGDEIAEYLKSKPAITDMIGVGRKARIYEDNAKQGVDLPYIVFQVCLLYTSPSPRDRTRSRMPSSA